MNYPVTDICTVEEVNEVYKRVSAKTVKVEDCPFRTLLQLSSHLLDRIEELELHVLNLERIIDRI